MGGVVEFAVVDDDVVVFDNQRLVWVGSYVQKVLFHLTD